MVEIYFPPKPAPGRPCVRVVNNTDAATLLGVFAHRGATERDVGEVVMIALGERCELLAVVAFGDVPLDQIVTDPRPLVTLARNSCCSSVVLAQIGASGSDVIEARRVIGSALEIDDIRLIDWIEVDGQPVRGSE